MKEKQFFPGDRVKLNTLDKEWEGRIIESHDPEVILLKLNTGYNIGIKEEKILSAEIIEKKEKKEKKESNKSTNPILPNLAIVITGGTISSRLDPKTGGVISTDAEEIINIAPELKEICNIKKIEKPFMKWSENMSTKDWKQLAETTANLLNDEDIKGVIISHGTDFLHYSAAALSFFLGKLNKPVALTYSQRSIDRGSTDAHLNLICAARFAISDIAEVAIIGHKNLEDKYCIAMPGTKTRKMHTSRRDAFKTINTKGFAEISKEDLTILKDFNPRNSGKIKLDNSISSKVALIKIYPGQSPEILEFYKNKGYKGIILEVAGIGQVPGKDSESNWLPAIKKLVSEGMTICATPQTINGSLNLHVYDNGIELEKTGIINLKDMLSETAFIKLSWILGHRSIDTPEKIKEKMLKNVSGEFNETIGF